MRTDCPSVSASIAGVACCCCYDFCSLEDIASASMDAVLLLITADDLVFRVSSAVIVVVVVAFYG